MPSPFPGMDLYLEDPGGWAGVHDGLISLLRRALNQALGPEFVADAGTSVYVVTPDEQRWVFPDVFVAALRQEAPVTRAGRIAAPVRVALDLPDTVSQPHVLIRDRVSRQVVTLIEVLSPINKTAEPTRARQEFLRKRADTMASATNWVEIDLLRAGERPPEARAMGDYLVLVKRAGEPAADLWPVNLRDRLPLIGVPLRAGVPDVALELQPIIDALYADGRYADLIDYTVPPPAPALAPADAPWAAEQVQRWQAHHSDESHPSPP
ncbi:MAG: DUF4058 family protein [Chloroflexi bacterium]|nr:DUF4058 family protein [Chloroflexota bacterium]